MKFSPTVPLALVLAAGMAAAAAAQTAPGGLNDPKSSISSEPKSSLSSEPKSTATKPQAGSTQNQQGLGDNKAMDTKAMDNKGSSSAQMQSLEPKAKSAEMKATQPRAKRIAHVRATHLKRTAHMKGMQASTGRVAQLQRPAMQSQNFTQAQQNLSPDQIRGAQEQLKSAGLYNGPTDGMMDPDTRAALARFQQQNGLRATQTLDPQTLARLNSGQTSGFGSSAPSGNLGTAPPSAGENTTTGQQPINR